MSTGLHSAMEERLAMFQRTIRQLNQQIKEQSEDATKVEVEYLEETRRKVRMFYVYANLWTTSKRFPCFIYVMILTVQEMRITELEMKVAQLTKQTSRENGKMVCVCV